MSKTATQTALRFAVLASLALLPIVPYALLGYAGQDLPFHVGSWLDLRDGWLTGHLGPGWSADANYGRGDPHLTLYPPVSCYLGALLTLILPLQFVPATFAWLVFVVSGMTMYFACKPFIDGRDRLIAAILYMLGPYLITTSLVRFAAAELLVQAWLPLIALYFYRAVWILPDSTAEGRQASHRAFILLVLLLGLSWVTNIPASLVLLYSLGAAALVGTILQRSITPLLRMAIAEGLGGTLAAFYLVPAWKEQPWIHSNTLLRLDPRQMLLFMPHSTFNDSPLLLVGWIFLCAQSLLAIACLRKRTLPLFADPAVRLWACLATASFLLQSPLSIPLWQHAPALGFVQFPLRFLSVIGVALPLLLLSHGTRPSLRRTAYASTAVLSVVPFLAYLSEQAVAANRAPPLPRLVATWQRKGAPEYLPAGAPTPTDPANMPAISAVDPSNPAIADWDCHADPQRKSADFSVFHTVSPLPCRVRMAVYFYPYWHASDESGNALVTSSESTGLLMVDIPSGTHTVVVAFRPASPIRAVSAIGSLLTFLLLAAALMVNRPGWRSQTLKPVPARSQLP